MPLPSFHKISDCSHLALHKQDSAHLQDESSFLMRNNCSLSQYRAYLSLDIISTFTCMFIPVIYSNLFVQLKGSKAFKLKHKPLNLSDWQAG